MKVIQNLSKDCKKLAAHQPQLLHLVHAQIKHDPGTGLARAKQLLKRRPQNDRAPASEPTLAKQEKDKQPTRRHRGPVVPKAHGGMAPVLSMQQLQLQASSVAPGAC